MISLCLFFNEIFISPWRLKMIIQKIQLLFVFSLTFLLCACGSSTPVRNEKNSSVVQQKTDRALIESSIRSIKKLIVLLIEQLIMFLEKYFNQIIKLTITAKFRTINPKGE
jgi:hypothetical protein